MQILVAYKMLVVEEELRSFTYAKVEIVNKLKKYINNNMNVA